MAPVPRPILDQCNEACEKDDPTLLDQVITAATSKPQARWSKADVVKRTLNYCIGWRAPKILNYLLEQQNVDVSTVRPSQFWTFFELGNGKEPDAQSLIPCLEVLLAHGWDIDTRGQERYDWPLSWFATGDAMLLDWCLRHGASVSLPGGSGHMSILERAAGDASVKDFEKLRAAGAQLGPRTLQYAVMKACQCAPKVEAKDESQDQTRYEKRLAMVRHLVETVGLDVNGEGNYVGNPSGTPLNTVAMEGTHRDATEVINYLLDHGADPDRKGSIIIGKAPAPSPLEFAYSRGGRDDRFAIAVRGWQAQKQGDSG